MKTIAIIGSGFSGTMCAINLARLSEVPLHIFLIDRKDFARGAAYKKTDECFLLNVRADQMGAFAYRSGHFYEWLLQKNYNHSPSDFVSRSLYGDYLQCLLEETQKTFSSTIELIQDEVLDLNPEMKLVICKNTEIAADKIILASGLATPVLDQLEEISRTDVPLTIIGTGLSMIDAVVFLEKNHYRGKITAVSRHGRLPAQHQFYSPETPRPQYDFSQTHSLRHVLNVIKVDLKNYEWHLVIDALRPHNQFLWSRWTLQEKGQFYRYCRSLWDVHRHRMSPVHKKILDELINTGRLEIKAVGFKPFAPQTRHVLELKGLSFESPLLKKLMGKNLICKDALGLGVESAPDGEIEGNWLFTLGPLRRGQLWECTAVPEIRKQAQELAERLLESH